MLSSRKTTANKVDEILPLRSLESDKSKSQIERNSKKKINKVM